jgi:predicted nucleic acid-binding protein
MGVIFDSSEIIFLERDRTQVASLVSGRARIWASLAKKGLTVGAHDLIIAATAISLDYSVITANRRDFEKIEG